MIHAPGSPTVTIIVLNFNGLQHLTDCFASLTKIDYPSDRLELMLVDNASTDGSVEYIQTHYPQVRIVQNAENLGFGSGNNVGARAATSQYVLFLNNDMRVEPQLVKGFLKAMQHSKAVCAGAKILNWDGTKFDFCGSAGHLAGYAYQEGMDKPFDPNAFTEVKPILFPCGGAMMVDREVFLQVGGFDGDYFLFYEDSDLGWRLWVLGYEVVFAPDAVVYHRHNGSTGQLNHYRKQVLYKRNALWSVIKNYSDENLGRVLPAVLLATTSGVVQQAVQSGQINLEDYNIQNPRPATKASSVLDPQAMSTLVAIQDVVKQLPQIMSKRQWIQANRQRSDQEVAQLFRWPFRFWPDVDAQTQYAVADAFGLQELFADLPRRVLVISSDILPYPGLPTVGSGLRAWGLGQGLKTCGHDVVFSMPKAAIASREDALPPEVVALAWEPGTLLSVIHAAEPDVVIVCNWPIMNAVPVHLVGVPVILDQHGPHLLEREYQKYGDLETNTQAKLEALGKADFFTCAGNKQLAYFKSWLERAGWTEDEIQTRTAAIPISLSPELPERHLDPELSFVYGGVFLPWQDPSLSLSVLVEMLNQRQTGKLYFFGGKHPVYQVDPGIFETLLAELSQSPHVVVPGMVPHAQLIRQYTQAHVAIDVMKRNPERELAFTTRTVEYLWCGLPVIYNNYSEISEYIQEYNAGWIVDPEDREAIATVLQEIFDHPEQVLERSQNAQRLVRERLTWDRTITPIDQFVRHPSLRPRITPEVARLTGNKVQRLLRKVRSNFQQGGVKQVTAKSMVFLRQRLLTVK